MLHRVDDHEAKHGNQNNHDEQGADERRPAAKRSEFGAGNLPQRTAVAARRQKQDGHVLHAAAEHGAHQNP